MNTSPLRPFVFIQSEIVGHICIVDHTLPPLGCVNFGGMYVSIVAQFLPVSAH